MIVVLGVGVAAVVLLPLRVHSRCSDSYCIRYSCIGSWSHVICLTVAKSTVAKVTVVLAVHKGTNMGYMRVVWY